MCYTLHSFQLNMNKLHLFSLAILCMFVGHALCFVLQNTQKEYVDSIMTNIMNCRFDSADSQCDRLISNDTQDPLGLVMRMSSFAFWDLDCDHPADTTQFLDLYKKTSSKIIAYESRYGASSYSKTLKGFSKAVLACYDLWHKSYLSGLNIGFGALDDLKEAKRIDVENTDADFFIGLYNYTRADMKKMFWWALFWYSGDKESGIKSILMCKKNGQIIKPVAALVLAELWIREKKYSEAKHLIKELETAFPKSRFVKWTHAKYFESQNDLSSAASLYGELADEYSNLPKAIKNELAARLKESALFFEANNFAGSKAAASKIISYKNNVSDPLIKQAVRDAEKIIRKINAKS